MIRGNGGIILRQGKTEVLGEKHYTASVVDEWMSMEHWWNDTETGKNWRSLRKGCANANLSTTNPTTAGLGSNLSLTNHSTKTFIKFGVKLYAFLTSIQHGESSITVLVGIKLVSLAGIKEVLTYIQTWASLYTRMKYVISAFSKGGHGDFHLGYIYYSSASVWTLLRAPVCLSLCLSTP
jgi:hypothetical protein